MEYNASTAPQEPGPAESQEGGIFDPYLQSVPDSWEGLNQTYAGPRATVENYLRDAEKNVNTQLREAADLRKQFGDYKDIDLSGVPPQQLASVIDFVKQVGQSPEAYQEWLRSEAEAAGLVQAQQEAAQAEDGDLEAYIQQRIEQALNPLTQRFSQYDEAFSQREQQDAQRDMEGHIESTLGRLEAENHVQLTDEQQEAVLALGDTVEGQDWVEQGFAKYQQLAGKAQAAFVQGKMNQPSPAMRSGGQAAPRKPVKFDDASLREMALEMANQAM